MDKKVFYFKRTFTETYTDYLRVEAPDIVKASEIAGDHDSVNSSDAEYVESDIVKVEPVISSDVDNAYIHTLP